jgi:hypothetical protein
LPRVSILCETNTPARSGPVDNTHHLVVCCAGSGPHRSLAEGTRGLLAPAGRHRQILQVDRGLTPNKHHVRAGGGVLHQHHPSLSAFRDRGVPKPTSECAACPSPDGSSAWACAKGGEARWPETGVREVEVPRPSCSSRAQVGCACSRGVPSRRLILSW